MYETLSSKISKAIAQHGLPEVLQTIEHYMSDLHMLDVEGHEENETIDKLLHSIGDATEIACKFETMHKTQYKFHCDVMQEKSRKAAATEVSA